jgi:hypothetical protein
MHSAFSAPLHPGIQLGSSPAAGIEITRAL